MGKEESTDLRTSAGGTVLRLLRLALHGGFLVLLAIAVIRLDPDGGSGRDRVALGGAVLLALVYCAGAFVGRHGTRRAPALVWLAAVTAIWAALLLVGPDFAWLAFPLFFIHLHLLRRAHAVAAVLVITGAVIATQALHAGRLSMAMMLGPLLGAAFAVVIALGYAALYRESEQRRVLIDDLTRTRGELAASQHQAGVLAERERLAREIHDTLAQGLSSIVLLLRSAETTLPQDPAIALARIAEARESASANLAEARRFVRDLAPPSLSGGSLPEALRRLCERTGRDNGIDCRFRVDGSPAALPPGYEVALLRAAQASLANVTAHARAATAVVTLGYLGTEVTLDVYDDGVGFAPDPPRAPRPDGTGFGLPALRERIAGLGGRLDVESAAGEGTAVAIRLPLTREENP
ncbi:signal transduction histidine kinase [Spinactinospora alkalitolerans]|uniref:Oxygen sensor histidine kinase NreB n=1 Tax=Spinactinospora alkalitolerans TaxID=687207 RepID=A0A852TTV1_9ACTN|nr:sensor histidine kinase [Spinactinospora alkalitolerans]NYE45370.1 signal transduction histidine kinase [Spinactinospora alkalitolerans]